MAGEQIDIALIGSKFMGRAHSNAWMKVPKFFDLSRQPTMHTIAARNEEELKNFAARWGWHNFTTDWRLPIENPEIDLIDIGVPNHMHAEMAIAALEGGKNVACEKPLADNLDHARTMMQAAKKAKKCQTFVWYNYRRCPAIALAHQIVKEGRIGKIYHVRANYLQDWAGPDAPLIWRFQGDVAGSGSLGDLCAHSIDTARFITGEEITEISGAVLETFIKERYIPGSYGGEISGKGASKTAKKGKSTVDDAVLFLARFAGGAVASFEATRLATGYKNANTIEVHGEKGGLRFDFENMNVLDWYDATLESKLQGWSSINVTSGAGGHPWAKNWWPTAHIVGYEHSFINMAADICVALAGEEPIVPLPDFADAFETQKVLYAVTESARNRCPIKMSQIK